MNKLMKFTARLVLASYITQLLAPIAHACEVESAFHPVVTRSDMRDPSPPMERMLQQPLVKGLTTNPPMSRVKAIAVPSQADKTIASKLLEQFQQSPSDKAPFSLQSENYQYRLRVKSFGASIQKHQLKLSRKTKGSTDKYEKLHTSTLFKGKLDTDSQNVKDDALGQLFQRASTGQYQDHDVLKCSAWQVPGFGTINIGVDGSVIINQDEQSSILSSYDLVLKTSNDLFIRSLQVAALSLTSPKKQQQAPTTRILRYVAANTFYADHHVLNLGCMYIDHQIAGPGKLTNHGMLNLKGTSHDQAILNIHAFENKKLDGYMDPEVQATHLRVKGYNHHFINGENGELLIVGSMSFDLPPKGSALINKGKITAQHITLCREAINFGSWQAYNMIVISFPFINKHYLNILNSLSVNAHLINEGDINVKKSLEVKTAVNTGNIKGDGLDITVKEKMYNKGKISLLHLSGSGHFINSHELKFEGERPAIFLEHFHNLCDPELYKKGISATLVAHYLLILSKEFINEVNARLLIDTFSLVGRTPVILPITEEAEISLPSFNNLGQFTAKYVSIDKFRFHNRGVFSSDHYHVVEGILNNFGRITGRSLKSEKSIFRNDKGGNFTLQNGADIQESLLLNEGEITTQGSFVHQSGKLTNEGTWTHTGDIQFGNVAMYNKGEMAWHNGIFKKAHVLNIINHGNWYLGQISCSQLLNWTNYGTIKFSNSSLTIASLVNCRDIIFSSGQYVITNALHNNHLISFQDNDWVFTDDESHTAHNRLLLKGYDVSGFSSSGEVESSHPLTYDVKTLPKAIRATGNLAFTKRQQHHRTLDDLHNVRANCKVTYYCPSVTTTNDYEFGNISHLELFIDGLLRNIHSIKAQTLTLDVEGDVICGESNDKMGSIASTKGPLNISGHKLDVRYGKLSSKGGATTLTASKGNVLIGAARSISKGSPFSISSRRIWYGVQGSGIPPQTGLYSFNMQNGAFVASEYGLTITSPTQILVDYGKLMSGGIQRLNAGQLVRNKTSSFHSLNKVIIESPEYWHTRDSIISNPPPSDANHIIVQDVPGSDPASIEALGNIELFVNKIHNIASLMFGENIWINGQKFNTDSPPSGYFEESQEYFNREWTYQYYWQAGCVVRWLVNPVPIAYVEKPNLLGKKDIQFLLANFLITGRSDANNFKIIGIGSGSFKGSQYNPHTVSQPIQFNLTKIVDSQVSDTGIIRRSPTHEIYSEVFSNHSAVPKATKKLPMLETANNRHLYRDRIVHLRFVNPLNRLHSGLYNLYLRQTIAKLAGSIRYQNVEEWFQNGIEFSRELGKHIISQSDLKKATREMLFYSLREEGGIIYEDTEGYIPLTKVNPSQGLTSDTIDIRMQGDLTVTDYQMTSKTFANLFSEEHLDFLSTTSLQALANGTQEVIDSPSEVQSTHGGIMAIGKKGFTMTAAKLKAMLRIIAGSIHGDSTIQDIQLKRTEHFSHEEDGGMLKGKTTTHTSQVTSTAKSSEVDSTADTVTIISGKEGKTSITGSMLKSIAAVIFEGKKVETHASAGINSVTTHTTTEGAFTASQSKSVQQTVNFNPTTIISPAVHIETIEASYRGTDFMADVIYDNTRDGASFGPTTTWLEYFHQTVSESPLLTSDVGIKGGYETMYPCHMMVNKIVRNINDGAIKFESVDWDKDRTQIIGKLAETTYQLKQWQTSWSNVEQVIPDEALVVVALGITIATQGWGAGFAAETLGLGATASGIFGAGVASISTQFGTSALRSGDPLNAAASLFTEQYLRSLATTLLTSGGGAGNLQGFTQRLMANGLKAVVRASVSSVIEKRDFESSLKDAGISAVVESISGAIAEKIGKAHSSKINPLSSIEHKLAHFALGFGSGAATGALLGHDNILEDALTSGAGAVIGECVAESLANREQLMEEARIETYKVKGEFDEEYFKATYRAKLQPYVNIGRLVAGAVIAATGRDPSMAIAAATNALENNFMGPIRIPREVAEGMRDATGFINEAIVEVMEDIRKNPKEYVEDAAIGLTPYADIVRRVANGEEVSAVEFGIETGLTFVPIGKIVNAGAKTGGKIGAKFAAAVAKKMEKNASKGSLNMAKTNPKMPNNRDLLHNLLANEQLLKEPGHIIAGKGSKEVFKNEASIVAQYGGNIGDWVKKSSHKAVMSDGRKFQIHWVENLKTGQRVEQKTKFVG